MSVKTPSNVCPTADEIQGLSSHCQESVEILSNSRALGQRLDIKIQYLSNHCPIENPQTIKFCTLDIVWTNIGIGKNQILSIPEQIYFQKVD